jgi:hypothetical protein
VSRRAGSVAAWTVGGLAIAATIAGIVLNAATNAPLDAYSFPDPGIALAFPLVGALIASRRPENSVGWVMLAAGAGSALTVASGAYAYAAQITFPGLPGEAWAGWLQNWVWSIPFVLIASVLLVVFPDGRVPSRWWRGVVVVAVAFMGLIALTSALIPTVESGIGGNPIPSPFPVTLPKGVGEGLQGFGFVVGLALMIVCVVGLVRRFRRSSGVLRAQLSWFTYGYVVGVVALVASVVIGTPWSGEVSAPVLVVLNSILPALAIGSIAVGVGIAVFRYRLFDIDRIISRTLLYSLLTALLVGVYAVIVIGIGTATGRSDNPVLIAGATLVVAALFGPARSRLQSVIDRRLYRRRYDAERVLTEFGSRLRDEVDVDELRRLLGATAERTVQPERVRVWIRGVDS